MKVKRTTSILLLLLFCTIVKTQDNDYEGESCLVDSDCSPPYYTCESKECTHKSFWAPQILEIAGITIQTLLTMIAVASGIGGGAFFVPISLLFYRFGPKAAISMSNGVMFFNAFVVYIMSIRKSHPTQKHKTLIDYNLAILLVPPMMIGNLIGSIAAVLVPSLFQIILLTITLLISLYKTQSKARLNWKKESLAIAAKKKAKEKEEKEKGKKELKEDIKKGSQEEVKIIDSKEEKKEKNENEKKEENKKGENNDTEPSKLKSTDPEKEAINTKDTPDNISRRPGEKEDDQNYLKRLQIIRSEGTNFNWRKLAICYSISFIAFAFVVLRGGKDLDSVLGIERCDPFDIIICICYLLVTIIYTLVVVQIIKQEQLLKAQGGWKTAKTEFELTSKRLGILVVIAILTGFIGAIVGIGGSMILSPVLLEFGVPPQVISNTVQFLIFLNKAVATSVFIVMGILPYDYLLVVGGISMVAVVIAVWRVNYLVKKLNRQSLITFAFIFIVILALLLIVTTGVITVISDPKKSIEFENYC